MGTDLLLAQDRIKLTKVSRRIAIALVLKYLANLCPAKEVLLVRQEPLNQVYSSPCESACKRVVEKLS